MSQDGPAGDTPVSRAAERHQAIGAKSSFQIGWGRQGAFSPGEIEAQKGQVTFSRSPCKSGKPGNEPQMPNSSSGLCVPAVTPADWGSSLGPTPLTLAWR